MATEAATTPHEIEPELRGPTPRRLRRRSRVTGVFRQLIGAGLVLASLVYWLAARQLGSYDGRIRRARATEAASAAAYARRGDRTPAVERVGGVSPETIAAIEDDRSRAGQAWAVGICIGAVLYAVAGGIMVLGIRQQRGEERLLSLGVAVVGVIVGRRTLNNDDGSVSYRLTYMYRGPDRKRHKNYSLVSQHLYDRYRLDAEVTILCDPDKPDSSLAYYELPHDLIEGHHTSEIV